MSIQWGEGDVMDAMREFDPGARYSSVGYPPGRTIGIRGDVRVGVYWSLKGDGSCAAYVSRGDERLLSDADPVEAIAYALSLVRAQ